MAHTDRGSYIFKIFEKHLCVCGKLEEFKISIFPYFLYVYVRCVFFLTRNR